MKNIYLVEKAYTYDVAIDKALERLWVALSEELTRVYLEGLKFP